MPSGYCFEYQGVVDWKSSDSGDWDIGVYSPNGRESRVGLHDIDNCRCVVFYCPDGIYRAVSQVNLP